MAKSSQTVIIGCRLPSGLTIDHPVNPDIKVTLKSRFTKIGEHFVDGQYSSNEVDSEFWATWVVSNPDFPALKSGSIFVVKSEADAKAANKELTKERTGFEPMQTDGKDPRATGVKAADKE